MTDLINFRKIRCYRNNNSMGYYKIYKNRLVSIEPNGCFVKNEFRINFLAHDIYYPIFSKRYSWLSNGIRETFKKPYTIFDMSIRQKLGRIENNKHIVFKNKKTVHRYI